MIVLLNYVCRYRQWSWWCINFNQHEDSCVLLKLNNLGKNVGELRDRLLIFKIFSRAKNSLAKIAYNNGNHYKFICLSLEE